MLPTKRSEFYHIASTEIEPCFSIVYTMSVTYADKKVYKAIVKTYQLLLMKCTGLDFGLVYNPKIKDLKDRDTNLL